MKHIYSLILIFILFFIPALNAQIVINEVSSATVSTFLDEDGDQEDWIEFYNTSTTAVNMNGYTISREEEGDVKTWKFPSIIIKPNNYLTLFCSNKNRSSYFDHWEVPVYAANPWKYFLGIFSGPSANWRSLTFNDASWQTGIGGIGYGDADDSTITPAAYSVFMRRNFYIADTSIIPTALLLLDYDDGFVAYLNDVEIARSNIGVYGDHPVYNASAYDEHEATAYQNGSFSGAYFIEPAVIDSALKPGNNVFSIQVHNFTAGMNDLSAIPYFLIGVNDTTITYFPFPADVNLHSNFDLKSTGQVLTLKNAFGNIVDQKSIGAMTINNTYGRRPNGANNWYYFETPTPDTTNNTSAYYTNYVSIPFFSLPAGFYPSARTTTLSTMSGIVRYTTDGSDPTQASPIYTSPILIDSTMVIRARVYSSNPMELPGEIITNTYFINEEITLPVVSLTSDPFNLFDYNYGIYELGPNAGTDIPFHGANFWQGWERPANIEYFDEEGRPAFETPSSIAIQGNYSKAWPQRGFAVRTDENYKGKTIKYPLFPGKPEVTEFKSFNIRNAGSDWNTCHMRDRFNQKNAQKSTHLDVMDGRPCVLFINGKYWGVYELREKQDKHYIESNSDSHPDHIDFLQFNGSIIEGSNKGFLEMVDFIDSADMSTTVNYNKAKTMLDIENFADYFITETYIINYDWLGSYTNNIKFWRPNNPVGKWRYVLWDTDLSLGFSSSWDPDTDFLNTAIDPPTSNPHSKMLKSMLDNVEFRNYFVNRYADLMNTIFQPQEMKNNAYALRDEMLPEMTRHFGKWGNTSPSPSWIGRANNVVEWKEEIDYMLSFGNQRIGYAREHIKEQFDLVKEVAVTLNVYPPGAGKIIINTITPGSLPWTGVYFDGVPVIVNAVGNNGYEFSHWTAGNLTEKNYTESMKLNISSNDTLKAFFNDLENSFTVYPNPFNNMLTINYELETDAQVGINLYTVIGQEIAEIVSPASFQKKGNHTVNYDVNNLNLAQGIYFIQFESRESVKTVKLVRSDGN
jgi:hypothetical protein